MPQKFVPLGHAVFLGEEQAAEVMGTKDGYYVLSAKIEHGFLLASMRTNGELHLATVPLTCFKPSGDGTTPDFARLALDEYGHSVIFGEYEAASDAIAEEAGLYK